MNPTHLHSLLGAQQRAASLGVDVMKAIGMPPALMKAISGTPHPSYSPTTAVLGRIAEPDDYSKIVRWTLGADPKQLRALGKQIATLQAIMMDHPPAAQSQPI